MPSRRAFLSGLGAGVAALGLPRAAMANDPGPYNILEIYLSGAIAHRETFWTLGSEAGSPLDAVNGSTIGSAQRVAMGVSDGAGGDQAVCASLSGGDGRILVLAEGFEAESKERKKADRIVNEAVRLQQLKFTFAHGQHGPALGQRFHPIIAAMLRPQNAGESARRQTGVLHRQLDAVYAVNHTLFPIRHNTGQTHR